MVAEAIVDREIRDRITNLLAYQRDSPIHVRIVSPWIHDVVLSDGKTASEKIRQLITFKGALVTLLVNPTRMTGDEDREFLRQLEDAGVKVHYKRDLHAKAVLLRSRDDIGLVVMSANFTHTGLGIQQEIGVYLLNDLPDLFVKLDKYVAALLKETNLNVRGGEYDANVV